VKKETDLEGGERKRVQFLFYPRPGDGKKIGMPLAVTCSKDPGRGETDLKKVTIDGRHGKRGGEKVFAEEELTRGEARVRRKEQKRRGNSTS